MYASCLFRGELIIGGYFTQVGGIKASCLARWDGSRWHPFGSGAGFSGYPGQDRPAVLTLLVHDDHLYVGGHFSAMDGVTTNGPVARWDGTQWHGLPALLLGLHSNNVWDMTPWNGGVLIGGDFYQIGDEFGPGLAFYDGEELHAFPPGQASVGYPPPRVRAITSFKGDLIVAGALSSQDPAMQTIARWDGNSWSALGEGFEENPFVELIWDLAADDSILYAAGQFQNAGGESIPYLAAWNDSSWEALGSGLDGPALFLSRNDSGLLVGGCFTVAGNAPAEGIARWTGTEWVDAGFPSGLDGCVLTVTEGTSPFVGGVWTDLPDMRALNGGFAVGDVWIPLAGRFGFNNRVYSFGTWNNQLVAGGVFTYAGTTIVNRIARWDGQSWNPIGAGFDLRYSYSGVRAIQEYQGDLYAGGDFYSSDGVMVVGLARWDGDSWTTVNLGPGEAPWDPIVNAMCLHDSLLVVGGRHARAAGIPVGNIAGWDGSVWRGFSTGMNGEVKCVVDFNGQLIAAGDFLTAGGVAANRIARWNGLSWEPMGNGFNNTVYELALYEGKLVAAGTFLASGSVPLNNVAAWDGTGWSTLGDGLDGGVLALAACDGGLYAGGYFRMAQGAVMDRVAYWNGLTWEPVKGGVGGTVLDMINAGELWAGGELLEAGGIPSSFAARLDRGVPVELLAISSEWEQGTVQVRCDVSPEMAGLAFGLFRGHPAVPGNLLLEGRLDAGLNLFRDPAAPAAGAEYWIRVASRDGSTRLFGPARLSPRAIGAPGLRAFPNPFAGATRFVIDGIGASHVQVFDLRGRLVRTLSVDADAELTWDGRNQLGEAVGSGIYLVRVTSPAGAQSIRVLKQD